MSFSLKVGLFISLIFALSGVGAAQESWVVVRSEDPGDLITVCFTSSKKGFIAGDNGYFSYTTDGGDTWQKQFVYTTSNINEIYFRNDNNGYVVAGKKLFITADGGRSWRETIIFRPGDFIESKPDFLSVRFANKDRGVIIGSVLNESNYVIDSLVMRTDDGGKSWIRIVIPFKDELYHLDLINKTDGWIVGDNGLILHTDDGGLTWRKQNSGTTKALYNIDFRDDNHGIAVGEDGTILRTENGGATWKSIRTGYTSTFLRVDFTNDQKGWVVGHNGTILRSSDKGLTWIKEDSKTDKSLYGLFMTKKYGWAVGADGTILRYEN